MKPQNLLYLLPLLFFSLYARAEDLSIKSVSAPQPWSGQPTQEIKIEVQLPKGFHAYSDQFRISNISPSDFKAGNIVVKPETEFFDKYTKKTRKGLFEDGHLLVTVEAPAKTDAAAKVAFDLRYQICSDNVCYLPASVTVVADAHPQISAPAEKSVSIFDSFEKLIQSSLWLSFASIFLAGILTSFTPCIFPMLPITISILGHHAEKNSRLANFSRSLAYVLGIAFTMQNI